MRRLCWSVTGFLSSEQVIFSQPTPGSPLPGRAPSPVKYGRGAHSSPVTFSPPKLCKGSEAPWLVSTALWGPPSLQDPHSTKSYWQRSPSGHKGCDLQARKELGMADGHRRSALRLRRNRGAFFSTPALMVGTKETTLSKLPFQKAGRAGRVGDNSGFVLELCTRSSFSCCFTLT